MSVNDLTPQQDIATRQFFMLVVQDLVKKNPSLARALTISCLDLLNYDLIDGKFVTRVTDHARVRPYGNSDFKDLKCEWVKDYTAALKAGGKDVQRNHQDSIDPSASVEAESAEVGEAVLQREV